MRVIIIITQEGDWAALFIENDVVFEGHTISSIELLKMADNYRFKAADVQFGELNDEDEQIVAIKGSMDGFINPNSYYDDENDIKEENIRDFTMCKGEKCPVKETCRRYLKDTANSDANIFIGTPGRIEHGKFICALYWSKDADAIWNQLKDITEGRQ